MKKKAEKTLRPIHPNAGIEADYRRRLTRLIDELHNSVVYWLKAAYRANQPEIASDESPAAALRNMMRKLARRWLSRFDKAAKDLASYFAQSVSQRSDAALKKILKDGGISVEWRMTRAQNDVLQATITQNVALIRSIPQQYLGQVEQSVMRSVQAGRDLGPLAQELEQHYGVSKRRAAFISRSQNNLATAALTRARQLEIGITTALWQHSQGGKTKRPSHVANSGKEYDVAKGWFDPDAKVWTFPGALPNCRCVSRSVIVGFY